MRTLTEKYNGVLKGTYTKDQFIREARMQFPNLITQHNSYQDATRILLNKGIITENVEEEVVSEAYGMSLEDAKEEAQRVSEEEGVVQHVEETEEGSGKYRVSDFYDSDLTVISYEYGRPLNEEEEVVEKKLTSAEKKGKEKIVKGLKKSGMSKDDPATYAIATAKAKELYEGPEEVNGAYEDIVELVKKHARRLDDDDAYELHEQLKSFFNRLLESDQQPNAVQVGDVIDHKGVQKKVVRIDGHRVFLQPVDSTGGGVEIDRKLGIERDLLMRGKTLGESKEVKYESPKAELPLDVLHHGIRFELDKKGIGNTPNQEEYLKAYKLASKNITKDLLFYKKEEGAEQLPDNPTDQMTKVKLKEGIKEIIKKLLSEDVSKVKKPFNIKGQLL
jgi:hypothetical protein